MTTVCSTVTNIRSCREAATSRRPDVCAIVLNASLQIAEPRYKQLLLQTVLKSLTMSSLRVYVQRRIYDAL